MSRSFETPQAVAIAKWNDDLLASVLLSYSGHGQSELARDWPRAKRAPRRPRAARGSRLIPESDGLIFDDDVSTTEKVGQTHTSQQKESMTLAPTFNVEGHT